MKPLSDTLQHRPAPIDEAPHELAAAVNRIEKAGLFTDKYDRGYWLRLVKSADFTHPDEELKRLLKRAWDIHMWLSTKGERLNRGAWLTNRLTGKKPS